jgi:hypothetical protein
MNYSMISRTTDLLLSIEITSIMEECDSRTRAYKNGKTFDQCRDIAKTLSSELETKINQDGKVGWDFILESAAHDELVYKLTLKYLRQDGYDIGDWKRPRVTKTIA